MFFSYCRGDAIGQVALALAQCHHPQAFVLSIPVQQGVELRAQPLTHRDRDADQLVREFIERVAQAEAETRPWKQRPQTAGRAGKAIGQDAPRPIRRLLPRCDALKFAIGGAKPTFRT